MLQQQKCFDIHSFLLYATRFGRQFRPSSGDITIYKTKTDKTKEQASPLQYYSNLKHIYDK
jgi:hypothetical protein